MTGEKDSKEEPRLPTATALLAVAPAATAAAAFPAPTLAASTARATRSRRARLVHHQRAAHERFPVHRGNGAVRLLIVLDLHKTEAARLPRGPVAEDGHRLTGEAALGEPLRQILIGTGVGDVSNVQLFQERTPSAQLTLCGRGAEETGSGLGQSAWIWLHKVKPGHQQPTRIFPQNCSVVNDAREGQRVSGSMSALAGLRTRTRPCAEP